MKLKQERNWIITKANDNIFNEDDINSFLARGVYDSEAEKMECFFKSFDDDGELYFKGYTTDNPEVWENVFEWCMFDSGCTRVTFHDTESGDYIDEIS